MTELNTVTYFCPGSCSELATEQPRDTGQEYYGPAADDEEEDDGQLTPTTSLLADQQQSAKPEAKPEPGTYYSLPESCVSGNFIFRCVYSSSSIDLTFSKR